MTTTTEVLGRLGGALNRVRDDPSALATLRRAIGHPPLDRPETWRVLVPIVYDAPWAEVAVQDALTLYAVHQQSQPHFMHQPGQGVGLAARRLRATRDSDGVDRRMASAAAASSTTSLAQHLRGLVTLLRGAALPLDYLRLTRDLLDWTEPQRAAAVRRRWARDYYNGDRADLPATAAQQTVPAEGAL